ncbi:MAG: hypothetical protein ABEH81_14455 [Halopenitus sp.]
MSLEDLNRRAVLASLTSGGLAAIAGCNDEAPSTATERSKQTDTQVSTLPKTPSKPEHPTVTQEALVKEYYGDLELNEKQPYYPIKIPVSENSGCYLLEYRLNRNGFGSDLEANLNLFLLDYSYEEYKNFVNPGEKCFFSICLDATRPAFNRDWLAENYAASKLNEEPIYKRVLIPNDSYHLVIDATSAPDPADRGKSTASANLELSLRLTEYSYERAEKLAMQTVGSLINGLPDDWEDSISSLRTAAQEMCASNAVESVSKISLNELEEHSTKVKGISSAAADILSVLESRYSVSLPERPLRSLSNVVRWGGKHLPIIGSVLQVAESACLLASTPDDAEVSELRTRAKSLFVSLALLAGDLVMSWWGVTSRIAYSLTSVTSYLLGYLRQVVGLRFYTVVLKNTLFLFENGISDIIGEIYNISERIAENTKLISDKDLRTLLELNEDNVDNWKQLAFLNDSNECGTVISSSG